MIRSHPRPPSLTVNLPPSAAALLLLLLFGERDNSSDRQYFGRKSVGHWCLEPKKSKIWIWSLIYCSFWTGCIESDSNSVLDNECLTVLKEWIIKERMNIQHVEPDNHRVNAAKRAIQTFKNTWSAAYAVLTASGHYNCGISWRSRDSSP